jgi:integrase
MQQPVRQEYLETVFSRALKTAGVEKDGRKLVPLSLRFTYVTRMRRNLEADTVKQLAGHSSVEMTDYYTADSASVCK